MPIAVKTAHQSSESLPFFDIVKRAEPCRNDNKIYRRLEDGSGSNRTAHFHDVTSCVCGKEAFSDDTIGVFTNQRTIKYAAG
jgi:hypothetical protein